MWSHVRTYLADRVYDGFGVQGAVMHYTLTIALVSSAFLLFLYFWYQGQLDMDEEPKNQMIQQSDEEVPLTKDNDHG